MYTHRQRGTLTSGVLSACVLVVLVIAVLARHQPTGLLVTGIAVVVLGGVAFLFGSLQVVVADGDLRLRFGPGVVHRTFPLADIVALRAVVNSPLMGWGIHYFPGGVLYNVSGREAVEVTMRSGKKVRVGTDEPQALLAALCAATGLPEHA